MPDFALIGLGSNLGDREAHLDRAVAALAESPGVTVRAVSSYHETPPVGGPEGQGAFLNAAAALETTLGPEPLLDLLNAVEDRFGRVRSVRWGERTLDLDLLLYGSQVVQTPRLTLPHPRMTLRRFVLAPLSQIAPEAVDPRTGWTIAALLANLDRRPSSVALHGPDGPVKEAVRQRLVEALGAPSNPAGPRDRWLVSDSALPLDRAAWQPRALAPTFAVVLEDEPPITRWPFPLLFPDSRDPDTLTAEVVAACAATRAG